MGLKRSGFMDCLAQLTAIGNVTQEDFQSRHLGFSTESEVYIFLGRFKLMRDMKDYYVVVLEDKKTQRIVGTGALIVERKFIHACSSVRAEDGIAQINVD